MNEEQFKPLDNEIKIKPATINFPEIKKSNQNEESKENIITELPTWNIEPPIEIKRGQQ